MIDSQNAFVNPANSGVLTYSTPRGVLLNGRQDIVEKKIEADADVNPSVNGMPIDKALEIVDKLEKLIKMYENGSITEQEFRAIKNKIIRT